MTFDHYVQESVAQRIGCNSPWFDHPLDSLPMCNSTKDIQQYDALYYQIFIADEHKLREITDCKVCHQRKVLRRTSFLLLKPCICQVPCTYQHFSLVGSSMPVKLDPNQCFLFFVTTDILEDEEVLVFPLDSLVSEFGGALGLFLGISFLDLCRIVARSLCIAFKNMRK